MLHQKVLVTLLDRLRKQRAFDISSIDKIIFIVAIAARYDRLPNIAAHMEKLTFVVYLKQRGCDLTPENVIDQILAVAVSGGVKLRLIIVDELKCDIRVGKRKMLHHIADVRSFRLRCL